MKKREEQKKTRQESTKISSKRIQDNSDHVKTKE